MASPLELLEASRHLDFKPVGPILYFSPPDLKNNKFLLFSAMSFIIGHYSTHRKWLYMTQRILRKWEMGNGEEIMNSLVNSLTPPV